MTVPALDSLTVKLGLPAHRFPGAGRAVPGRRVCGLAAVCVALMALAGPVRADTLIVDLSQYLVAITTSFAGTKVLLFGTIDGPGDVVVIVRGPDRPVVLHRKKRVLGIWLNAATMTFDRAPSFYAIASSRPLSEIASDSVRVREEMGIENLRLELPRAKASPNVAAAWRDGLIRNHQALGLYPVEVGKVIFLGNRLFRADVKFPANVPTGIYQVNSYFLRDGRVVRAQRNALTIEKAGIEARVFDFAHNRSAAYGLIAILVALVAGWLGHMAFRKP
ncbi:MAG: TIGR02186 family protein [Kiloniellaceae bacterium]